MAEQTKMQLLVEKAKKSAQNCTRLWTLEKSGHSSWARNLCFVKQGGGGGFSGISDGKVSAFNAGDPGSIPGLGRSSREEHGKPLQYSCLENPIDRSLAGYSFMGSHRVGHDWVSLSLFTDLRCLAFFHFFFFVGFRKHLDISSYS